MGQSITAQKVQRKIWTSHGIKEAEKWDKGPEYDAVEKDRLSE